MCTKTIYLFESHHRVNRLIPECVYIQQMLRLSFIYSYLFHDFRMFCRWWGMLLFMSSVLIFLMCDLSHISRVTQSIHHPNWKDSIYTDNKKKSFAYSRAFLSPPPHRFASLPSANFTAACQNLFPSRSPLIVITGCRLLPKLPAKWMKIKLPHISFIGNIERYCNQSNIDCFAGARVSIALSLPTRKEPRQCKKK